MTNKKYHPASLIGVWGEIPVTGTCFETGEKITFKYQDIIWELEGMVDNCYPVNIRNESDCLVEELNVFKESMQIIFPDSPDDMTPLQRLALMALPFSHWHPEEQN